MQNLIDQLKRFHEELEPSRRNILYGVIVMSVMAVLAVGYWSSTVSWQALISGAPYDEVLEAAAALDEAGVQYKIDDQARLMVPAGELGKARGAIASSNVLPGLGDVADLKLGLTPHAQSWAFLRAKQGDLARMINGIKGVSSSFVHVVPRRDSLFLDEQEPARASVFLQLRPGAELGSGQIKAIINMVANSVEGLTPDRVSLVDDRGNLLSEGTGSGAGIKGDDPHSLLEIQQQKERAIEQSVSQAILPILGYDGGFSVTAAVDLDASSSETVSRTLNTDRPATLSETMEESESAEGAAGGVPGVDANLPERAAASAAGGMKTSRTTATTNFDYPEDRQTVRRPAGMLKRMSVAVQVDSARVKALAEAAGVEERVISENLQRAVEASVGYDVERGDVVSVNVMPFAESPFEAEAAAPPLATATALAAAPHAVAALGLILLFLFVIRPMMAMVTKAPGRRRSGLGDNDDALDGAARSGATGDDDLAERLRLLVDNYQPVDASDLNRLVNREAPAAAQVLRQWKRSNGD